jgi:uncharacterized YceG family protein
MSGDGYPGWQDTSRRGRRARPDSADWDEEQQGSYPGAYYQEPDGYAGAGYSEPNAYPDGGWNGSVYQTDPRGRTDPQGQTDPAGYYGEQDPYGRGDDYAGGSGNEGGDAYADPYGRADTYQAGDPYGDQQGYDRGGGDSYAGYDTGAQPGYDTGAQPGYDTGAQPGYDTGAQPGYDSGAQPGYDYRDDSYAGQPGYDQAAPYDDFTQAGSGPLRAYQPGDRYATDDPSGWRGQQGGIGAPGDVGERYGPTPRRERAYQRGAAGQDGPLGGSRRSGRGMEADEDRHSGFFSGFPGDDEDDNYGRRRRRGIGAGTIALIVVIVVIAGIGGVAYHYYSLYKSRHASFSGSGFGTVDVIVKPGDTFDSIAPQLLSKGVIAAIDPWDAFVANKPDALQPGEFRLHEHMGSAQAWAMLVNPASKVDSDVTIVDGRRESVILANLAAETGIPLSQFQAAAKDTKALGLPPYANGNLEGYLYPDTYPYVPGSTTALGILQAAVHEFNVITGTINLAAGARKAQFTEGQVITEASLLEAEVGPKYYKDVARTLDNRLTQGMPLQLDSTVAYATGKYIYALTSTDLHVNSPYNTFLHTNLPPGPIDSPDLTAIEAVLDPAPPSDNSLYFVTVNKQGLTLFTNSNAEFQVLSQEAKHNGL